MRCARACRRTSCASSKRRRYHFYNALGLLGIGAVALSLDSPLLTWAAALIVAGIVLFSGSLYAIARCPAMHSTCCRRSAAWH